MTWSDARLTEKGRQQALALATFLGHSTAELGMPAPRLHCTSPLARCLETTRLAFSGLETPGETAKPRFIVKEKLRERLGVHTCDRRSSRSWIQGQYRGHELEEDFAEGDELWKNDSRESLEEHAQRVKTLLADIFDSDPEVVVSFTAHSGSIRALYMAIGHEDVWVGAGEMVPVLIRAEAQV